eukprot:CAMPEP_0183329004 /NCGR_PEP_ID=MMETSP0160_2-20130417/84571_1 /TAXON_ID=2839 ORGANISM="Odontella Sinensis, Strain Grunow 1884" /NCGR_SAMPLE_ID=MMETSP0160_2 /ASSEMBLY_ACC=CAM_ASM_000250 /LENGTH=212 /DNA_ID=CAMNT_0025497181 /DNA_START=1161 /DNA_END=1796 /DNA_ORIENTATION=+
MRGANIWAKDKPIQIIQEGEESDNEMEDQGDPHYQTVDMNSLVNLKGDKLNADFLNLHKIGKKRAIQYFVRFYIDTRYEVKRSEADRNIGLVPCTASKYQEMKDKLMQQHLSLDAKVLKRVFVKRTALEMVEKMVATLDEHEVQFERSSPEKLDKTGLLDYLIQVRRILFQHVPGYKEDAKQEAKRLRCASETSPAQRRLILAGDFYSLSEA